MAKANAKEKEDVEEKDEKGAAEGEAKEGEGAGAEGAAADDGGKAKKKKMIIIGALAAVLLIAGGAGVYFSGILSSKEEVKADVELGPDGKPLEKPIFYNLPEFLVNLNVGGKQTSFLKTTIILELANQEDVPKVEANLPRLLDAFNTYLRELRASDLAGSAGIQRLREELLLRANKALAPIKINDVLFKEIIVQ